MCVLDKEISCKEVNDDSSESERRIIRDLKMTSDNIVRLVGFRILITIIYFYDDVEVESIIEYVPVVGILYRRIPNN